MLPYTCQVAKMRVCQTASLKATKRLPLQPFGNVAKHFHLHPKRCFGNLYANLQRQPCQLVVQQTKIVLSRGPFGNVASDLPGWVNCNIAKELIGDHIATLLRIKLVTILQPCQTVNMQQCCGVARISSWQPHCNIHNGSIFIYIANLPKCRTATIMQRWQRVTALQPYCIIDKRSICS